MTSGAVVSALKSTSCFLIVNLPHTQIWSPPTKSNISVHYFMPHCKMTMTLRSN